MKKIKQIKILEFLCINCKKFVKEENFNKPYMECYNCEPKGKKRNYSEKEEQKICY